MRSMAQTAAARHTVMRAKRHALKSRHAAVDASSSRDVSAALQGFTRGRRLSNISSSSSRTSRRSRSSSSSSSSSSSRSSSRRLGGSGRRASRLRRRRRRSVRSVPREVAHSPAYGTSSSNAFHKRREDDISRLAEGGAAPQLVDALNDGSSPVDAEAGTAVLKRQGFAGVLRSASQRLLTITAPVDHEPPEYDDGVFGVSSSMDAAKTPGVLGVVRKHVDWSQPDMVRPTMFARRRVLKRDPVLMSIHRLRHAARHVRHDHLLSLMGPWWFMATAANTCSVVYAAMALILGEAAVPGAGRLLLAFAAFLDWIMLLQYFKYNGHYSLMMRTMKMGLPAIIQNVTGALPIFFSFIVICVVFFGQYTERFDNIAWSAISLFAVRCHGERF
ncbi:MAG: hypothetical protein EOO65_02255 [Methanosarcinales archaeon]|nr:MAG: hypothetical protein EOO65_02255 [Methanosarcinales archaeon]